MLSRLSRPSRLSILSILAKLLKLPWLQRLRRLKNERQILTQQKPPWIRNSDQIRVRSTLNMSKTDKIDTFTKNTEKEQEQQLSNSEDHDYYVARGQKSWPLLDFELLHQQLFFVNQNISYIFSAKISPLLS